MVKLGHDAQQMFRVWIAGYRDWQPARWYDLPPRLTALELADEKCLTAAEAASYVAAYNGAMLMQPHERWAVPVPVVLHYDGDLHPGQDILPPAIDLAGLRKYVE